ncbi:hypothetical protein RI367_005814 [Sorochytrium milnesiophthora]
MPARTNQDATDAAGAEPRRFLRFLYLHPRISPVNFATYLFAVCFSITFFVFLNAATTFVLSEILGIKTQQGDIIGALGSYDELLSIFMVVVWGVLSDRFGRRPVYAGGFVLMGAALFCYTIVSNVYPQLLLARLLFALGASACSPMLTAVLADCAGKLRGRISGLVGLMSGVGALLAVGILLPLPVSLETKQGIPLGQGVRQTFFISGGIALAVAVVVWFGLSRRFGVQVPPVDHAAGASAPALHTVRRRANFVELTKAGVYAARDWRVLVAYVAGFAARGNTIIITTFLPLWINQYYISNGLCQVTGLDPDDSNAIKQSCRAAFRVSSILGGVTQVYALIGAPIWGILTDRFGGRQAGARRVRGTFSTLPIMVSCVIAFVGYLLIFFVEDPRQSAMYFVLLLVGFGEIGTVITSVSMMAEEYIDPEIRGSVAGVYSFVGGLGILTVTRLGGYLFDAWKFTAPFLLISLVHLLVAVLAAVGIVKELQLRRAGSAAEPLSVEPNSSSSSQPLPPSALPDTSTSTSDAPVEKESFFAA